MPNGIVTIYCCGTGGHRGKGHKWAVPHLYDITTGDGKFICDGPGSASSIRKLENVLKRTEQGKKVKLNAEHGSSGVHQALLGATGKGTQDNVILCMQYLWTEWYAGQMNGTPVHTINLVGWSRGAVTCIMLAHAIGESGMGDGNAPAVNIFAFDPVPGGANDFGLKGDFDTTGRVGTVDTLAACVTNYSTILQENIKKKLKKFFKKDKNFVCTVPRALGNGTNIKLYPLPGGHGDAGKYRESEGGGCVGQIGIHLAQDFLISHGTTFDTNHRQDPIRLIEFYAQARAQYVQKNSFSKKPPSQYRMNVVANAMRDHDYYVNSHHATLVQNNLPELGYLIDGALVQDYQINLMEQFIPHSYSVLVDLGIID